ncbi:MAG TPA: hypothetical protein VFV38_24060, partial [Ktedonobacteraceae bacterium]|nr:hypothetical protein [Ktedonobacteraceae bacterium]
MLLAICGLFLGCTHHDAKPPLTASDPSAGSGSARALMEAQAPLVALAERITKMDRDDHLGGIRLEVENRTVKVWWKGDPPPKLRSEMNSKRDDGVRVELFPAQYSQAELLRAAKEIPGASNAYTGLVYVGPMVDGSGLEVGLSDVQLAQSFPKMSVPIKIVQASAIRGTSRANDSPPWWGGAV